MMMSQQNQDCTFCKEHRFGSRIPQARESKVKGHTWLLAAPFVAGSRRAREHVQTPFTVMQ